MQYKFLNIFLDPKELLVQSKSNINSFLLENNSTQIEKIYNFFKSNSNLLFANGFLGTGKAQIINYSTAFLSAETILLKYNCFNSTILDDVLLSFFSEFKKLSSQNIISTPKIKTENFTQKVNSYFSQIEKPFVIILDSFEAILEENRQEILDFIFHLTSMPKIKIIIIGRLFESKYFQAMPPERVTMLALEREIFEKYLKSEKVKASNAALDEFYKNTRGYYFFTTFSLILMKNQKMSLVDFLTKFNNSYLPFHKFLEKQALTLIPASERNLFWFLATIRHPISIDLLKKLNLFEEEKLEFLTNNLLVVQNDSQIYIQDYLKEEVEESISPHISQRIRQYIIDLYQTQLPLKPLERNICVSRQTMRKEIEYHQLFLPKKPKTALNANIDINYLSYAKVFDVDVKPKAQSVQKEAKTQQTHPQIDLTRKKNIQINLENLPFQQNETEISSIKKTAPEQSLPDVRNLTLKSIIDEARNAEVDYNYLKALNLYQKALLLKDDEQYKSSLPLIYTKMASAYKKNADWENSLKYYELAHKMHEENNDLIKANYTKFSIAKIFYETYKIEKAKELLLEIVNSSQTPEVLALKCYLQLANIEEGLSNSQNAFEYYKMAIKYSKDTTNIDVLSELYFKYALIMDDKNDTIEALKFYTKCINLSDDLKINKFLSPTYSNMATLYLEKNDTENAVKNYLKAYEIDKQNNNIEGMYYSSSKLAVVLQRKQPKEALKYFNTALDCATLINDVFYIVSASLAIGDYHYDQKQNEIALKYYIQALDLAQKDFSQDNLNKINIRINDIKFRIGVEQFENVVEIIRGQEQEHE